MLSHTPKQASACPGPGPGQQGLDVLLPQMEPESCPRKEGRWVGTGS